MLVIYEILNNDYKNNNLNQELQLEVSVQAAGFTPFTVNNIKFLPLNEYIRRKAAMIY